jgi:ASC-1-like (ASCH) protein
MESKWIKSKEIFNMTTTQMKSVKKELIIDDSFASWDADSEGVVCYVTSEREYYFAHFKTIDGKIAYVGMETIHKILDELEARHWSKRGEPLTISINEVEVTVYDKRTYQMFHNNFIDEPDYTPSPVDFDTRWAMVLPVVWYPCNDEGNGITSVGMKWVTSIGSSILHKDLWGYNGISKGDKVLFEGKEATVVMVSRFGDFGLSFTSDLPYVIRVSPKDVQKLSI